MAKTFSALLGYDSRLALKGGFIDLSPMIVFNLIAISLLIINTIIPI